MMEPVLREKYRKEQQKNKSQLRDIRKLENNNHDHPSYEQAQREITRKVQRQLNESQDFEIDEGARVLSS